MSTKHSKALELKDRDKIIHELLKQSSVFSNNGQHQSFKEFDTTVWGKLDEKAFREWLREQFEYSVRKQLEHLHCTSHISQHIQVFTLLIGTLSKFLTVSCRRYVRNKSPSCRMNFKEKSNIGLGVVLLI